jgi:hypothetical protein
VADAKAAAGSAQKAEAAAFEAAQEAAQEAKTAAEDAKQVALAIEAKKVQVKKVGGWVRYRCRCRCRTRGAGVWHSKLQDLDICTSKTYATSGSPPFYSVCYMGGTAGARLSVLRQPLTGAKHAFQMSVCRGCMPLSSQRCGQVLSS